MTNYDHVRASYCVGNALMKREAAMQEACAREHLRRDIVRLVEQKSITVTKRDTHTEFSLDVYVLTPAEIDLLVRTQVEFIIGKQPQGTKPKGIMRA